jgi:aspartyl-tRNA(Asn)/glutamyl-tRNA(Gln) amidotransferase subunit A
MPDLTTLGIAEAGRLMARGELTATALAETFLKRIKAIDHKIASYITVTEELALNAAHQADMEMKGGVRRGPMHGIPVALKDIYETAGIKTTGHSHLKVDYVPAIDAETVRRLKDAGAVIRASSARTICQRRDDARSAVPGRTRPWNTKYQPGGSSAARGPRWRQRSAWARWAPTPAARSAIRRAFVAPPASSQLMGW